LDTVAIRGYVKKSNDRLNLLILRSRIESNVILTWKIKKKRIKIPQKLKNVLNRITDKQADKNTSVFNPCRRGGPRDSRLGKKCVFCRLGQD